MQLTSQRGDDIITLDVEADGDGWQVRLPDGSTHRITAERGSGDVLRITEGDRTFTVPFARTDRGVDISFAGSAYQFRSPDGAQASLPANRRSTGARKTAGTLTAPMGGIVVDVLVDVGQTVDAYAPLVIVEAMKVYATIEAPFAGTVRSVGVKKGDRVELGQQLVDIAKAEEDGTAES